MLLKFHAQEFRQVLWKMEAEAILRGGFLGNFAQALEPESTSDTSHLVIMTLFSIYKIRSKFDQKRMSLYAFFMNYLTKWTEVKKFGLYSVFWFDIWVAFPYFFSFHLHLWIFFCNLFLDKELLFNCLPSIISDGERTCSLKDKCPDSLKSIGHLSCWLKPSIRHSHTEVFERFILCRHPNRLQFTYQILPTEEFMKLRHPFCFGL